MPKNNKLPKMVLLDQLHVDIYVQTDLPSKTRKDLMKFTDRLITSVIMGGDKRIRVRITR